MNKMDLIAAVADQSDLPKAKAAAVVDAVFSAIEQALKKKEEEQKEAEETGSSSRGAGGRQS